MAYPSFATLTGTVTYSDGVTLFDGWVLLLLAFPSGYTYATVGDQLVPQQVGDHIRVRIQNGVYDGSARIYFNTSIQPPSTKYVAYFYDNENTQLGVTALFTVSSSPYTISVPSMTKPSATAVVPTP